MKVENIGGDRETEFFLVDGRKVNVPVEAHIKDRKNPDDITMCFYVSQAVDQETDAPINDNAREAIAKHITDGCTEEGVKFEIVNN